MSKQHDANTQTSLDMANARTAALIDVASVRDFLHDGRDSWTKRQEVIAILSADPVYDKSQREFMTRTERYSRGIRMTRRFYELRELHNWSPEQTYIALGTISADEALPIQLHMAAFEPVVLSQGSPEILEKYGELIATRGILGCYMQTELGHGTNVARLETTATFIPETQEFEINSPTLTSSKWWVGALAKTSTHGVVQAKLILPGGRDAGPHLFFMQLRSLDNHRLLPGIITGDIGPKAMAGYAPTDNGFARFDHVRIPKENMLSKFAQVTEDGNYVKPPHAKLSYGGMIYIRSTMVTTAGWTLAKAATVSIRYATVRRQGEIGPDGHERQVISYPSTYYRLLPILSHAYVFIHLGRSLSKAFDAMSSSLASGDMSLLPEMHATTSGLKVLVTTTTVQDIETARRSMGGHGFSAFSGLGSLYANYLPSVTYEGDNFVLDMQVVRAALKSYKRLFDTQDPSTSTLSPSSYYLRLLLKSSTQVGLPQIHDPSAWDDLYTSILLLEWRAALIVQECARNLSSPDASVDQRVSKAVTEAFVAVQVGDIMKTLSLSGETKRYVQDLFKLYLLTTVETGLVDLLSFGLLSVPPGSNPSDPTRGLRTAITKLCGTILPQAISLSDAFGFTDWELDSALGVYDGKVYEALWDRAQTEPLNRSEVPEAYDQSLKSLLKQGQRLAGHSGAKL